MNFEDASPSLGVQKPALGESASRPMATSCDTCRYIAEQGGTTTALDAYEVLVRTQANLRARVAALEARLADSPEVESSREAWMGVAHKMTLKLEEANDRIAALEAANTRMWDDYVLKRDQVAALEAERERLAAALAFYADPDTYFAMTILADAPAGAFIEDFDENHGSDYDRPMPGKRARAALAEEAMP